MLEQFLREYWGKAAAGFFALLYLHTYIKNSRTDTVFQIKELYNGLIEDLKGKLMQVDELQSELKTLKAELKELKEENKKLLNELETYRNKKDV